MISRDIDIYVNVRNESPGGEGSAVYIYIQMRPVRTVTSIYIGSEIPFIGTRNHYAADRTIFPCVGVEPAHVVVLTLLELYDIFKRTYLPNHSIVASTDGMAYHLVKVSATMMIVVVRRLWCNMRRLAVTLIP